MSTTYPTTKQTFSDPSGTNTLASPDHAGLHTDTGDTVEAIQDAIGTTAGTNVLKDFAGGQFPARVNSGGTVLQTLIGGTINKVTLGSVGAAGGTFTAPIVNNATVGTPAITGGTANSITLGTPTINTPTVRTWDGWVDANETWTYASTSTITVPSGAASKYQKGDRIKWTQTTVKYGVIIAVADTLLTIAVNSDYTVANAAISANYYSHEANPIGYPTWFNFVPTLTGFSTPQTVVLCKYAILGKRFDFVYSGSAASGTSNATGLTITVPVSPVARSIGGSVPIAEDSGTRFGPASIDSTASGQALIFYKNGALAAWTASGTKGFEAMTAWGEY